MIDNKERALVANIAAAGKFTYAFAQQNWAQIEEAKIFYSAGFFLTVSPETIVEVGKYADANGKDYGMNLSAPFLVQFFKDQMMQCIPYMTYMFGNELEAQTFAEQHELPNKDIREVAKHIAALPQVSGRNRRVVFTQGKDATIVADSDGTVQEFPVELLDQSAIVDVNGAGDSFVGGFLAMLNKGEPLERCVAAGHYAAREVI